MIVAVLYMYLLSCCNVCNDIGTHRVSHHTPGQSATTAAAAAAMVVAVAAAAATEAECGSGTNTSSRNGVGSSNGDNSTTNSCSAHLMQLTAELRSLKCCESLAVRVSHTRTVPS